MPSDGHHVSAVRLDADSSQGWHVQVSRELERKNLKDLKFAGYLVTEKTDGIRYFMYITKYDNKQLILMIGRNLEMYQLPLSIYDGLYANTIIDGELVDSKDGYIFNVFDAVQFCGENLMKHGFHSRFGACQELMKMVFPSEKDPFTFRTKAFYPVTGVRDVVQFGREQGYETDGLVFYPTEKGYSAFRQWDLLKWKPLHKNTVDFMLTKTEKNEYAFAVFNKGVHTVIQTIVVRPSLIQVEIETALLDNDSVVCECKWDSKAYIWLPQMLRRDKHHANDMFTFEKTVLNISENIRLEELYVI